VVLVVELVGVVVVVVVEVILLLVVVVDDVLGVDVPASICNVSVSWK